MPIGFPLEDDRGNEFAEVVIVNQTNREAGNISTVI
jgi:hypothetical protein